MEHSIRRVNIVRAGAALAVALALTLPAGAQTTRAIADQAGPATAAPATAATIGGQVVDRRNALAIAGAAVTLLRANTPVASVTTDAAGHYTIPSVAPGVYDLTIRATGYGTSSSSDVVVAPGAAVRVDAALVATQSAGAAYASTSRTGRALKGSTEAIRSQARSTSN